MIVYNHLTHVSATKQETKLTRRDARGLQESPVYYVTDFRVFPYTQPNTLRKERFFHLRNNILHDGREMTTDSK